MSKKDRVNFVELYREMDEAGLNGIIAFSPYNFVYLSGVSLLTLKTLPDLLSGVVVPRNGDPALVIMFFLKALGSRETWIEDVRSYEIGDKEDKDPSGERRTFFDLLSDIVADRGLKRGNQRELNTVFSHATLVAADDLLARTRIIKTPSEVDILRRAATATEKAIRRSYGKSKAGNTQGRSLHFETRNDPLPRTGYKRRN